MKKTRKILRGAMAVMLSFLLSTQALAASINWDLAAQGDLNITTSGDTYNVTGGSSETPTSNTITVADDVTTTINLNGVNIAASGESAIDVQGDANVTLNVTGENIATSDSNAAIHVTNGDLTITSSTEGYLVADSYSDSITDAAAIGSNAGEDMSGSITIDGNVWLDAYSNYDGAGIGSGAAAYNYDESTGIETYTDGNMSGSITISGKANVYAIGDYDGAGIGSGYGGDMSGTITISGDAYIEEARSDEDGAGIGSGENGDLTGSITITENAYIEEAESDEEGAGIGTGEDGDLSGSITIDGNAVVEKAFSDDYDDGAGIGAGDQGDITETGTITIGGNANVTAYGDNQSAGIGSGRSGKMEGAITIQGNATVTAYGGDESAAIGAEDPGEMTGTIRILDNATVTTGAVNDSDQTVVEGKVGTIGGGYELTNEDAAGTYVIGSGTTINGISGSNAEGLKDFVEFTLDEDGNPTNLTIKEPEAVPVHEAVYAYTLFSESKKVSVVLHSENGPTKLLEAEVDEETAAKLTEGVEDEDVQVLTDLSFDKEYTRWFTLWFHLGKDFAGKQVEIRWLEDGELVARTITVNAAGDIALTCKQLGSFAVIAK